MTSFVIATLLSTVTVCAVLVASEPAMHWFVIPVWCCGILIGTDAVDWFRGKLHLFDPAGVVGVMGVHFFFLAPLLHVALDSWMPYVDPPEDWRVWLGAMALLNVAALLAYQSARRLSTVGTRPASIRRIWHLERTRLARIAVCGLAISAVLQVWVYAAFGGISGYIDEFTDTLGRPAYEGAFAGMGWIFAVSESFPIIAMLLFAAYVARTRSAESWVLIVAVLVAYFALKMLFGGLRGSRLNTILGVFWAVGIIHLWIRPLGRRFVLAGLLGLVVFMYAYGFYKNLGRDVLLAYEDGASTELAQTEHRTLDGLLLGDLGRADVQAFLLYRLSTGRGDYSYAWGRTYLGAIALLIPRRLWPERPPTKVKEGTEALFGAGSFYDDEWSASNVYGLAGETMLNFGPVVVPFAYLVFGAIVGRLQRFLSMAQAADPYDARLLLYPLVLYLCLSILVLDFENLLFTVIKDGAIPLLIVWYASTGFPRVSSVLGSGSAFTSSRGSNRPDDAAVIVTNRPS
jgi:hypothetical protein